MFDSRAAIVFFARVGGYMPRAEFRVQRSSRLTGMGGLVSVTSSTRVFAVIRPLKLARCTPVTAVRAATLERRARAPPKNARKHRTLSAPPARYAQLPYLQPLEARKSEPKDTILLDSWHCQNPGFFDLTILRPNYAHLGYSKEGTPQCKCCVSLKDRTLS